MAPFGLLLLAAASWRPQIKAGYECLKPCDATTRASGRRACEVSDFRWDLLDALQHAGGLRVRGNGSVYWDTSRAAPGYSCDPAESNNQSLFMQHARSQGVKNILSLHPPKPSSPSYNASSEVFQLLANSSTRARAVAAASSMAAAGGFDGLSVDFEGSWTATAAFRSVFSDFVAELATTCSALSPPLTVSSALAHDLAYNTAEDATAQAKASTDGVVIMTYDYLFATRRSGANSLSRPNAPMYPDAYMGQASPNNNVNSSVWYTLQQLQVPPDKLTLGVAWYGKEVPTTGPSLGAKINVSTIPDSSRGREQTTYNYQQPLAEERAATVGGGRKWDNVSLTPWYSYKDPRRPWLFWQGFYDDTESLRYKYEMVKALGLRGVLIWDLNACTLGAAPSMWTALEQAFGPKLSKPSNSPSLDITDTRQ